MNNKKFERQCPICKKIITYSRKDGLNRAIKENRLCFKCSVPRGNNHYRFGKHCSEETKQKIRQSKFGVPVHSKEEKEKRRQRWLGLDNPTKILGHSPFLGKHHTDESKEKISKSRTGKNNGLVGENHPNYGKRGSSSPWFGKTHSQETKEKLRKQKLGVPMSDNFRKKISERQKGRKLSDETKRKMRVSHIKYIIEVNGNMCPMFNKRAIEYFASLEKEKGWNGKYATKNDGEHYISKLGYFVDYYEPSHNIVVEYDEPRHYYAGGKLKLKDIKRMNEIVSFLHCKFYRYNEKEKTLIEYSIDQNKPNPSPQN